MKRYSKFITILLVVLMILPGIAKATPTGEDTKVKRLGGLDRVETAIAASKEAYKDGASEVVLAGYNGEIDALTGTILAHAKNAPLLLTPKDEVPKVLKDEIERLGAKNIYILGGQTVVSDKIETDLKKEYTVKRIAGKNRAETAVEVAKENKGQTKHIFLAKGYNILADALSIGPVSAKKDIPVFLTDTDKIPQATIDAMEDLGVTHVTIIGGEVAVSKKVETQLKAYTVDRVKGVNREGTALAIAQKYFVNPTKIILVYGWQYPDALVGGYLGAKMDSPILLTYRDKLSVDTETFIVDNAFEAYILGGIDVVSDSVFNRVLEIINKLDLTAYNAALSAVTEADYTVGSWTTYQEVVNANKVTFANTQAEVDEATANIIAAQANLVTLVDAALLEAAETAVSALEFEVAKDLTIEENLISAEALVTPAQEAVTEAAGIVGIDEINLRLTTAEATVTVARTTFNATKQDNEDIAIAKANIEGATYTAKQIDIEDANMALIKVQELVDALELKGTTAEVIAGTFIEAIAGDSATPSGINGSYTFTVKVNKGLGTEVISEEKTMIIIATEYIAPEVIGDLLDSKASSDFMGVLYKNGTEIYYNQKGLDGIWGNEVLIGTGSEGKLDIDSIGKPHIVYTTEGKIGYKKYDGSTWTEEILIESLNIGGTGNCSKPDIAVDNNGKAHITYTDSHGSSDDYIHPDIMYANNVAGNFDISLIFKGYRDYSSSGSWGANYFNKGSVITLNDNGDYFISAYKDEIWRWFNGTDRSYSILVNSNLGNGSISVSSNDEIYDVSSSGGKIYFTKILLYLLIHVTMY